MSFTRIFPIQGVVQHYAWGGESFIPELLGQKNDQKEPWAEYWMGAHPKAPSESLLTGEKLNVLINKDENATIGEKVAARFGDLPYLFKVLDVKEMLSIQVHPSKSEAEKGFDAEEAAGIPISAPNRNYKDRNHKPEVMVALSEFWLLHGFLPVEKLQNTLNTIPEFESLVSIFGAGNYKGLYEHVMVMPTEESDYILKPLVHRALTDKREGKLDKSQPGWWVDKLYGEKVPEKNIDKGIFSIYFFNIVKALPGEAVFQAAGIPHAYLEGQNMELMANSDNVLRGGLTPKHVDVPELLKHTLFEPVHPHVMKAGTDDEAETHFPCPVPDFGLSMIRLKTEKFIQKHSDSLEILFVEKGSLSISGADEHFDLIRGKAVAVLNDVSYTIQASSDTVIFRAYVPKIISD